MHYSHQPSPFGFEYTCSAIVHPPITYKTGILLLWEYLENNCLIHVYKLTTALLRLIGSKKLENHLLYCTILLHFPPANFYDYDQAPCSGVHVNLSRFILLQLLLSEWKIGKESKRKESKNISTNKKTQQPKRTLTFFQPCISFQVFEGFFPIDIYATQQEGLHVRRTRQAAEAVLGSLSLRYEKSKK